MRVLFLSPTIGDAYGQERILHASNELLRQLGYETHFLGGEQIGQLPAGDSHKILDGLNQIGTLTSIQKVKKLLQEVQTHLSLIQPELVHFIDQFDYRIMNYFSSRYPTVLTAHTVAPSCPSSQRYLVRDGGACHRKSGWQCLIHHVSQGCLNHFKSPIHQAHALAEFKLKKKALQNFSAIAAISNYVKTSLIQDGFSSEKVSLILNPVSVQTGSLNPLFEPPKNLLVVASRLVKLKGIDFLLKDLSTIRGLSWTVWIFGDGPERASLEQLTDKLKLKDQVIFKGKRNAKEVYEALLSSIGFIQPNRGPEGFGMAAAEASFLGVPVICHDVSALNELIAHERTGLVVPLQSKNGFSEAIKEIISNPSRAKQMGYEGSLQIKQKYSREQHLQQTLDVYRQAQERFHTTESVSPTETFSLNRTDTQKTF